MSRIEPDMFADIRMESGPRDDTLYCNEAFESKLLRSMNSGLGVDNIQIAGLQVVTHEKFTTPICCKKGDIFPLAKDYKEQE